MEPQQLKVWDGARLDFFSTNYDAERTQRGPNVGRKFREDLLNILSAEDSVMKLSDIADRHNAISGRDLNTETVRSHLLQLIKNGKVTQPRPGFYQITQEIDLPSN